MKQILSCILAITVLIALALPACAESPSNLVLQMEDGNAPLPGVVFELYLVGEQTESGKWVLAGEFAEYPVRIPDLSRDTGGAAAALYAFAKKDSLTPYAMLETDVRGTAAAEHLAPGLYLIGDLPHTCNGSLYRTEPQLIAMPQKDPTTGEILQVSVLQVKFSKEAAVQQTVSRKVLKIWDDHSGHIRPDSVTVHLLKNGSIHDTVSLSGENQWRHTWEGLDANALWQIAEDVPEGYTVILEQDGNAFLLTNSAPEAPPPETEPPEDPGTGDNIPQTGMLLWPVFLLVAVGFICITAGILLRKDSDYEA